MFFPSVQTAGDLVLSAEAAAEEGEKEVVEATAAVSPEGSRGADTSIRPTSFMTSAVTPIMTSIAATIRMATEPVVLSRHEHRPKGHPMRL